MQKYNIEYHGQNLHRKLSIEAHSLEQVQGQLEVECGPRPRFTWPNEDNEKELANFCAPEI